MRSAKIFKQAFDWGNKIGLKDRDVCNYVNQFMLHPNDRYSTYKHMNATNWRNGVTLPKAEIVLAFMEFMELSKMSSAYRIRK
jgi:hypothetical protein